MKIKFGRDGQEIGEYPEEAVPALLQSKVLRFSDVFWHAGMPDWVLVSSRWPVSAPPIPQEGKISHSETSPQKSSGRSIKIFSALAMCIGVIVMIAAGSEKSTVAGMIGGAMCFFGFFGFVIGRFMD